MTAPVCHVTEGQDLYWHYPNSDDLEIARVIAIDQGAKPIAVLRFRHNGRVTTVPVETIIAARQRMVVSINAPA
jgi:hypothetical protein